MFAAFALAGVAWAFINVNSLPMVVEMAGYSDVGKFTGYYYTASMAAQIATPILSGAALDNIGYWTLLPYGVLFVLLSFITMLFVKHGDSKPLPPASKLEAFEAMDD
jgi:MFS family permease